MKLVKQLSNRQGKGFGKGNFNWLCVLEISKLSYVGDITCKVNMG